MKSTSHELMLEGFARLAALDRKDTFRSIISRGKHLDSIDWTQLPIESSHTLVDTSSGSFWFIPGYSIVGGGDRVKP